ncbi:hypothetical protein [Fluviispira vulneris]|uniref:hypothetical protein n=1 Tax=Fluviispira vulneris TaxID=2763012 RepID=UPI001644AE7C|nr:hypothetical protein [Fluviispira vulneris]
MIKSFAVESSSPADFIKKVTDSLAGRELGKIASMSVKENNIVIMFSKLGKSEVIFNIKNEDNGFSCTHSSEKIALTHKALRGDIEGKLAKVLESNGAKVTES